MNAYMRSEDAGKVAQAIRALIRAELVTIIIADRTTKQWEDANVEADDAAFTVAQALSNATVEG